MSFPRYESYKSSGSEGLGAVPQHWQVARLKRLLAEPLTYGANEAALDDDRGQPRFVRITDIDDGGNLRDETFRSLPRWLAEPYLLSDGDVLLARSGATVGKSFIYHSSWGQCCFAGYLIRARPKRSLLDPAFLYVVCQSDFYWQHVVGEQIQATIQNVSAERYANLLLPWPPLTEQAAITVFLDRQTAKIDTLVEEQQRLIELLKEKRQAVISHAVTKGLDPNVPMKHSGVEWLGEVPRHWEVKPLRRLLSIPLGNGIFKKKEDFGDGVLLINVFDIYRNDFQVRFGTLDRVSCTQAEIATYHVLPGDLFFVRSSLKVEGIAAVAMAGDWNEPAVFECHLIRARLDTTALHPRYATYLLNSKTYRSLMIAKAKITTMTTVDQEAIQSLPLLAPSLSGQSIIAAFLDRETVKIDALVTEAETAIAGPEGKGGREGSRKSFVEEKKGATAKILSFQEN